jgi:hypothetical protein
VTAAELEAARALARPGDTDAVTFSWADPGAQLYGLARLGRGAAADGALQASALAVLFSGRAPVGALVRGGTPLADGAGWERLAAGGLTATVDAPLERWTLDARGGGIAFSLVFEGLAPPATPPAGSAPARAGGMTGYEQICRVHGSARANGRERPVRGLGQRGHAWGNPDWDEITLTRALGAWLADGTGFVLDAVRTVAMRDHAAEATWAALVGPAGALDVRHPLLSTTFDADGRQLRAGVELWVGAEDPYPRRAAGEVVCGSTLDLGALRLDCAFFRWHMEGHEGVGRYDVLRRAR